VPRSRRPPEPKPEFFVDRSLGHHALATALRDVGFVAHTVASVYGVRAAERVPDEEWLERAGRAGWVVLTKDDAIRRRPAERDALAAHQVRAFCLTTANLTGPQQVERFLSNLNRILQRARRPGPWICAVYERQVVQVWPTRGR
jgi:hypothetical protein